tara:strand:- start:10 stop:600 length:591 start_codon:yes stop_codon:yes gene_type:complete
VGGLRSTVSTAELRLAQSRIRVEEENRKEVNAKRTVAADSLQTIQLKVLALQNSSDTVGELGPLQYLSGLTGTPMDKIINILLLVIIFVFDPLAISLVIAANFAFDHANKKTLYGEYEDEVPDDLWESFDDDEEDINDIEVDYDTVEPEEDWKVVDEEEEPKPKKIIQKGPSRHRVLFDDGSTRKISKDDNTIRYL